MCRWCCYSDINGTFIPRAEGRARVIPLSVAEIAAIISAELAGEAVGEAVVTGPVVTGPVVTGPVVIDSRLAAPGALFAALPGERVDGHDYADAAWSQRQASSFWDSRSCSPPSGRLRRRWEISCCGIACLCIRLRASSSP